MHSVKESYIIYQEIIGGIVEVVMSELFNMDNPFWRFMGKIADVIILNLLWVICCIPIITIGPATTATYYVALRLVNDEDGYIFKNFFKSFKQNFRQGVIIGIIMTAVGAFFVYDLYLYRQLTGGLMKYLSMIMLGIMILYLFALTYVFPILAKFVNSVKRTIINAFYMSIRHIVATIIMIAIAVIVIAVTFFVFPPLIILGFGLIAFLQSYFLKRIFNFYIVEEEPVEDDSENLFMTNAEKRAEEERIKELEENRCDQQDIEKEND